MWLEYIEWTLKQQQQQQYTMSRVCRYQVPIYFILFGLFYSLHFISFYLVFLSQFTVVEDSSLSRAHCTSSPLLQSLLAFIRYFFLSFYVSLSTAFLARWFVFFFFFFYYFSLLYSVSLILWLCRMRRFNAYLLFDTSNWISWLTAVCRRILIYLINKFVILYHWFFGRTPHPSQTLQYNLSLACHVAMFSYIIVFE